jgi:MFS family permease
MNRVTTAVASLASNRALVRVSLAWLLFILAEYSVWIAMLVYAYGRGGATAAGVVAVAQLLPGIVAGPLLSTLADRRSPVLLLVGGYVVQTAGMAGTAVVLYADGPAPAAYAGAIVAATAVTATRPAQAALIPALARSPDELTAANAIVTWLESLGLMLAGVMTGLALSTGQPGLTFACGAGCTTLAAALLTSLRVRAIAVRDGDDEPGTLTAVREGLAILKREPQPRLLVGLLGAEYVVIGAMDVLFVVLAVSVLHEGPQWTGYLNTAYGIGGMAAGAVTVALLGRRLGAPIMAAAAGVGVGLAVTAFSHQALITLLLLGAIGLAHAVLDMGARTLLQRTVPAEVLGRIFGVVEGLSMAGLALGSLLVPLLIHLGGTRAALIGTAAVLPLVLALGGRAITSLDAAARVPIVEIALLRAMPHFRALPTPALEGLAQAAERRTFADGETIIRQGDEGDLFYAIADGQVDVRVDGVHVATRRRPEGLGEIALLRKVPRTATVIAAGPAVLYALDGAAFVTVVTGHDATRRHAEAVATARLDTDPRAP